MQHSQRSTDTGDVSYAVLSCCWPHLAQRDVDHGHRAAA